MVTVYHPVDDVELMLIRSALEASGIPHFIVGQHFGSLYPGIQIPFYNERSVQTPPEFAAQALEVIGHLRATYEPTGAQLRARSKVRILIEALCFGWAMPGGKKKEDHAGPEIKV